MVLPTMSSQQNATTESYITNGGSVLMLQLKRYDNFLGNMFKDTKLVECLPSRDYALKLPIVENDIVLCSMLNILLNQIFLLFYFFLFLFFLVKFACKSQQTLWEETQQGERLPYFLFGCDGHSL